MKKQKACEFKMYFYFFMFLLILPMSYSFVYSNNISNKIQIFYLHNQTPNNYLSEDLPFGSQIDYIMNVSPQSNASLNFTLKYPNDFYISEKPANFSIWTSVGTNINFSIWFKLFKSNELICSSEKYDLTTNNYNNFIILSCIPIHNLFNETNFLLSLTVKNNLATSKSIDFSWDTSLRNSSLIFNHARSYGELNQNIYGEGEISTVSIYDTEPLNNYSVEWFNSSDSIICSYVGKTPLYSESKFERSCLFLNTGLQSNGYVKYTNLFYNYSFMIPFQINQTIEMRRITTFERILDVFEKFYIAFASIFGYKPYAEHFEVLYPSKIYPKEQFYICANITNQYGKPLDNFTCTADVSSYGTLPLLYKNGLYCLFENPLNEDNITWSINCI